VETIDFDTIETETLGHYDSNAAAFFDGTIDHDVTENYAAFLRPFPKDKKLDILDFGCGPGRDLKYFLDLGHRPVGLDGSVEFCNMARQYSTCDVFHQRFLSLSLSPDSFDGVFANASLFHVPKNALPDVLNKLYAALRPKGILFMSNPRGSGEGWAGKRYGHYMEYDVLERYLNDREFTILEHYYRPTGLPVAQQPWLAIVSQRPA
jgi:SAM-dependent methyltransferase